MYESEWCAYTRASQPMPAIKTHDSESPNCIVSAAQNSPRYSCAAPRAWENNGEPAQQRALRVAKKWRGVEQAVNVKGIKLIGEPERYANTEPPVRVHSSEVHTTVAEISGDVSFWPS